MPRASRAGVAAAAENRRRRRPPRNRQAAGTPSPEASSASLVSTGKRATGAALQEHEAGTRRPSRHGHLKHQPPAAASSPWPDLGIPGLPDAHTHAHLQPRFRGDRVVLAPPWTQRISPLFFRSAALVQIRSTDASCSVKSGLGNNVEHSALAGTSGSYPRDQGSNPPVCTFSFHVFASSPGHHL